MPEQILHRKRILSVADFIANAGGVIMTAMDYAKKSVQDAFYVIEAQIKSNTGLILENSRHEKILPRQAAGRRYCCRSNNKYRITNITCR